MAEENKGIRLKKAATELNVGISTLVEFLAKKGHQVETNPNTRLTAEQYDIVATAFQGERAVKEQADKIEITPSGNNLVVEASPDERKEDPEEVIIKNYNSSPIETKGTPKPVESAVTPDEAEVPGAQAEPAPVAEPAVPAAPAEEAQAPAPEATADAPAQESEAAANEAPQGKDVPAFNPIQVGDVRIINKIDLDAINSKMRPDKAKKKKGKAEKAEKTPAEPQAQASKAKPAETPKQKEKPVAPEPQPAAPEPVEPAAPAPAPTPAPVKEPEFIETQYQKLEGPKLVGMVDLSQFEKSKSSSGEKRKRKRIKNKGVKVNGVNGQPEAGQAPAPASAKSSNKSNRKAETPKSGTDTKSEKSEKSEKKKKKEKKVVKVEIDESEIEKQIRDTLARLSPMGKSKTSKHNREKRQKVHQRIEEEQMNEMESQKTLQVTEFVTANELATMMNVPVTQVISTCMSVGIFVSINQRLDAETIKLIADEFGFEINFASADVIDELNKIEEEDHPEDLIIRNPIVSARRMSSPVRPVVSLSISVLTR